MPSSYYSFPPPQVLYASSASYALYANETLGTASYAITASYAMNGGGGGGGTSQWTSSGANIYFNIGDVGIGTASPSTKLSVSSATNTRISLIETNGSITSHWGANTGAVFLTAETNHPIDFWSNGSHKVRISNGAGNGVLLVGTTSEYYTAANRGTLEVNGTSTAIIALKTGSNSPAGYLYTTGTSLELANPTDNPIDLITGAGIFTRMRIGTTGNATVTIGDIYPQFAQANRGTLELNGTTDTVFALKKGSVPVGYIQGTSTSELIFSNPYSSSIVFYTGPVETERVRISGSMFIVTGNVSSSNGFTGSLQGTASYALSSSFALTASYVLGGGGGSGSTNTSSLLITASFSNPNLTFTKGDGSTFNVSLATLVATSSSYALSSSFAQTASYVLLAQTASYVQTAQTASYVLQAVSSSYATSASYAVSSSYSLSGSYATSASVAVSSSYARTSSYSTTLGASLFNNGTLGSLSLLSSDGTSISAINRFTASLASTASYVKPLNQNVEITGSFKIKSPNSDTQLFLVTSSLTQILTTASFNGVIGLAINSPNTYDLNSNFEIYYQGNKAGGGHTPTSSAYIYNSASSSQGDSIDISIDNGITLTPTGSVTSNLYTIWVYVSASNPVNAGWTKLENQTLPTSGPGINVVLSGKTNTNLLTDLQTAGFMYDATGPDGTNTLYWDIEQTKIITNSLTGSFTGSLFGTASWAINVVNGGGGGPTTSASYANTASYVSEFVQVQSASIGGALYFASSSATGTGTNNIFSIPTSSYYSLFFDYHVNDGSTNARAGQIVSTWYNSQIQYNETTTTDIGNTNDVAFQVVLSGANAIIQTTTTSNWNIRYILRNV